MEAPRDEAAAIPGGEHGTSAKKKTRDRFTAEMKDRQARGKDPMTGKPAKADHAMSAAERRDALGDGKGSAKITYTGDGYEAVERRKRAMAILDSPELLMMYSQERGDSLASSRYHLQHVMCGIEDTRKPLKAKKATGSKASAGVQPRRGMGVAGDAGGGASKRDSGGDSNEGSEET